MNQLLILSGKGGTGKTTVAGAFIKLSEAKAYADCDVDAPNLHLIAALSCEPQKTDFYGMPKAEINPDVCIACGACAETCRFDAICSNGGYIIDAYTCEGCGVCEAVCPANAITLHPAAAGELALFACSERIFSTATLKMGSGTSGKLVAEVKKNLLRAAPKSTELSVIDGSPGIGCPVISSLSGASMVLIVAEPSLSGISDMARIVKTAEIFRMRAAVCVNKYDVNAKNTEKIETFCREKGLPFTGRIPFDPEAVRAINRGMTLADVDCPAGRAIREVFDNTMQILLHESDGQSS